MMGAAGSAAALAFKLWLCATRNAIPHEVANRCVIETGVGKLIGWHIVQAMKASHGLLKQSIIQVVNARRGSHTSSMKKRCQPIAMQVCFGMALYGHEWVARMDEIAWAAARDIPEGD
jgi:hypothetical protein